MGWGELEQTRAAPRDTPPATQDTVREIKPRNQDNDVRGDHALPRVLHAAQAIRERGQQHEVRAAREIGHLVEFCGQTQRGAGAWARTSGKLRMLTKMR